jgi:catechol 2,3-dioxygenase-like lactoylglutathione lyase family enzyme
MNFALDHVVIAVRDLAAAIDDYRALGFTVTPGGRHPPPRTSSNALVVFQDGSYLELISWDPPNPAERWSSLLREHGEGIVDFALIPEDLPRAVAEAKARGLHLNGPLDGQRLRPDGTMVRWQTARQETFDLPFLCADVTPRVLRVPEGDARIHRNGITGIRRVRVAVARPDESARRYHALLGRLASEVPGIGIELEARETSREGPVAIDFAGGGPLEARRLHGARVGSSA